MFYSHEILTQREYGVATIWLVATLGSRSGLRKVARKDILSCNLPKACNTVINPQAPLALRLQSNLLVGISRVYSKQFEYLYHDVWQAHTKLQKLDDPVKGTQSTLARGVQARPDQLVLQDDPLLHADLLLDLDLGVLGELRGDAEREADSLLDYTQSAHSFQASAPSTTSRGSVGGNVGFEVPESEDGVVGWADGNLELEEYPQFEFDKDGEIREVTPELPPPLPGAGDGSVMAPPSAIRRPAVPGSRADSEELAARVRQEHDEGAVGNEFGESGEPFGFPPEQVFSNPPGLYDGRNEPGLEEHEARPERGGGEEEIARKLRGSRVNHITIDSDTQLRAREIKSFTYDYAANMDVAKVEKAARKLNREAKKVAKELVLERGIGGHLGNPLLKNLFSGQAILDIVHGKGKGGGGGEAGDDKVEQQVKGDDQDAIMLGEGTLEPQELGRGGVGSERGSVAVTDPEVGREAPTDDPAGDIQSIRHSTPRTGSAIPGSGAIMSAGGLRSSSIASAGWAGLGGESPLLARSAPRTVRQSAIGVGAGLENVQEEDENTMIGDVSFDQLDFFGAAADVETQDANTQATLERKSFQFFESVKNKLAKATEEDPAVDFITFEGLIGAGAGYRAVAAQALHHTLLLATKAMIRIKQEQPYGSIEIRAIPAAV